RSYFLCDADDWLGYAHVSSAGEPDGPERFFERAYQRLRGRQWSTRERPVGAALLQVCASRPCIAIRASYGDGGLEVGVRPTQECFVDLQSISEQARRDCRRFDETKRPPDSAVRWAELAGRLAGQLRLDNLLRDLASRGAPVGCPILVETHGNGLHLPWCGLLAETIARPDAVLVSDLDVDRTCTSAAAGAGDLVLALNCFTTDDPLYAIFTQLAGHVGTTHVPCADRKAFRSALEAHPARLIFTGAHGGQRGILHKLSLSIGAERADAIEVWQGVRLPRAAVVVGFTCYGGGGESQATGEFGSIASLALRAGARAAVASRWPAWTDRHYKELLTALAASVLDPDDWRLAADVMRFVRATRGAGLWNSLGWGVYVPSR
ncbi:MAG TPA: hypothetical protein VD866_13490, partial [Urbifossiella sp.]|nr:hypothetical protein [Urbifossiella sp.]